MALREGEARHIWQWLTKDSIQGMVKIRETKQDKIQQPVNQRGLYVLVKEAVVPKEFKTFKEEDIAIGL
jgi:hypothetical protein